MIDWVVGCCFFNKIRLVATAIMTAESDNENYPMAFITKLKAAEEQINGDIEKATQIIQKKEFPKGQLKTFLFDWDKNWKNAEKLCALVEEPDEDGDPAHDDD